MTKTFLMGSKKNSSLYQFGDVIGKGATANVYRALDTASGRTVAIKHIVTTNMHKHELIDIMV